MEAKKFRFTKLEWSWILQDWANSAYSIMITTAVFPLYFQAIATGNGLSAPDATAYWGYANSIATLLISVSAPILGALADYEGNRTRMFRFFTILGALSTISFAFLPGVSWQLLLFVYVISHIGFSAANVFYDASIMDVTSLGRMDRVSSTGFAMGYIGSSILFVVFIFFQLTQILPIPGDYVIRGGFLATGLWWLGFSIPYLKNVKQVTFLPRNDNFVKDGFSRLWQTIRQISQHRNVFLFLIAYFLYIDGVDTIITMATIIGANVGIEGNALIVILLVVQIVAFPSSIAYGILSSRFGNKRVLYFGILTYIVICFIALGLEDMTDFLILAVMVGTAQGGVQALSRSIFGQIIPKDQASEFFGFYNIFGKFAAVIGPSLVGIIGQVTGNTLNGVFALIILFVAGAALLAFVKVPVNNNLDVE